MVMAPRTAAPLSIDGDGGDGDDGKDLGIRDSVAMVMAPCSRFVPLSPRPSYGCYRCNRFVRVRSQAQQDDSPVSCPRLRNRVCRGDRVSSADESDEDVLALSELRGSYVFCLILCFSLCSRHQRWKSLLSAAESVPPI
ncbi:unnamed protein product [Linum trigynum]|uniref:Uncharacterized protein n=1 Tax=Linum trigynum TaxID=586398 RepID=A0AAV2DTZ0_9ROSI